MSVRFTPSTECKPGDLVLMAGREQYMVLARFNGYVSLIHMNSLGHTVTLLVRELPGLSFAREIRH